MSKIELDPRKLLGFKIISDGESTARLTSPKIGDKGFGIAHDLTQPIDPSDGHNLS